MSITSAKVHHVSRLSTYSHVHTIPAGHGGDADEVGKVTSSCWKNSASGFLQRLFRATAQVEVLEIFDPAVNKWEGILHVARHHDVTPSRSSRSATT